jgi:hypothetical protein
VRPDSRGRGHIQAQRFESMELSREAGVHRATIPAAYTDSPFPLQYSFVVTESPERVTLLPGLGPSLTTQPCYVLRRLQ